MQRRSFLIGAPLVIAGASGLLSPGKAFGSTPPTAATPSVSPDESSISAAVLADVQQRVNLALNAGSGAKAKMNHDLSGFATQARISTLFAQSSALETQMQVARPVWRGLHQCI